jgi:hypothetical protein
MGIVPEPLAHDQTALIVIAKPTCGAGSQLTLSGPCGSSCWIGRANEPSTCSRALCLVWDQRPSSIGPKANGSYTVPSAKVCQPAGCSCSTCIFLHTKGGHKTYAWEEERTLRIDQNARTSLAVSLCVFALSLLVLLCFTMLPAPAGGEARGLATPPWTITRDVSLRNRLQVTTPLPKGSGFVRNAYRNRLR